MFEEPTNLPSGSCSTTYIKHLAVSGLLSSTVRVKSIYTLISNRFEMPNLLYTQPLANMTKYRYIRHEINHFYFIGFV